MGCLGPWILSMAMNWEETHPFLLEAWELQDTSGDTCMKLSDNITRQPISSNFMQWTLIFWCVGTVAQGVVLSLGTSYQYLETFQLSELGASKSYCTRFSYAKWNILKYTSRVLHCLTSIVSTTMGEKRFTRYSCYPPGRRVGTVAHDQMQSWPE